MDVNESEIHPDYTFESGIPYTSCMSDRMRLYIECYKYGLHVIIES